MIPDNNPVERFMRRISAMAVVGLVWCLSGQSLRAAQNDVETLVRDLSAPQVTVREAAAEALGALGPASIEAVPALVGALHDKDPRVQHEALIALGRIGPAAGKATEALQAILENGPPALKLGAIHALGSIGAEAKASTETLLTIAKGDDQPLKIAAVLALVRIHPGKKDRMDEAVPVLTAALASKSKSIRDDAIAALGEIGPPAVAALTDIVQNPASDALVASRAASALGLIGGEAAPAVTALTAALGSKSDKLQEQAARALGAIGPASKPAVPALKGLLASKLPSVRANAADALGMLGKIGAPAVPELTKALADSDATVRREAAQALASIGPAAKSAVPALLKALHDDQGAVTVNAAEALGRIGPDAVPALIEALKDEKSRSLVVLILTNLGPDAKQATVALLGLLKDKNVEVRREALIALAQIGPSAEAAIPQLLAELKNEKSETRPGAAYALIKIGAKKEVVPILAKTIQDPNNKLLREVSAWGLITLEPGNADYVKMALPLMIDGLSHEWDLVRLESVTALSSLEAGAKLAVPELVKLLDNEKNPRIRSEALGTLGNIGPAATEALPSVLRSLADPAPLVRYSACYTLGKIGPKAKEAVPVLVSNLTSKDEFLGIVSAWALVYIDPKREGLAEAVVPLLIKLLEADDPQARLEAIKALVALGPQSKAAVPALKGLSKDKDEGVRKAAGAAVKKVGG
ncbi:MAG: HEAT repeat domain-containing protein [Planctomycetaceae bacterium]|nr:HEAT repeat domain-containing protein [Planctomycetaceae bacterium]